MKIIDNWNFQSVDKQDSKESKTARYCGLNKLGNYLNT